MIEVYVPDVEASERMGVVGRLKELSRYEVRVGSHLEASAAEIREQIGDAEIICVALGPVTAEAMDAAPRLRLIVKCGIGTDRIDVDAARERGIGVVRVAGVNFRGVAEWVIGASTALLRRFGDLDSAVREGIWNDARAQWTGLLPALTGKTLGLVGLGSIGAEVARLGAAHEMRTIAVDPHLDPAVAHKLGVHLVPFEELLTRADVVSLHVVLGPETEGMVSTAELELMKPSAVLINSSRGPVVDTVALARALHDGLIAGAAIDVLPEEPPAADHPLLSAPRCLLSPHLAGCSEYGYQEIGDGAVNLIERFVDGHALPASSVVAPPAAGAIS